MADKRVRVPSRVAHEILGDDVVVHIPACEQGLPPTVITLTGAVADVFRRAHSGDQSVTTDSDHVRDLIGLGILHADVHVDVSRRNFLAAGTVGLGAGIALLALPQAALASSNVVELSGRWRFLGADSMDFDTVYPPGFEPTGDKELTVTGISGAFPFFSFNDATAVVRWRRSFAPGAPPTVSGTLIGSFSSSGIHYRVTFSQTDPE